MAVFCVPTTWYVNAPKTPRRRIAMPGATRILCQSFMNLSRIGGNSGVAALTPDVSVVSILALLLGVLLLSLGLLLGSPLATG